MQPTRNQPRRKRSSPTLRGVIISPLGGHSIRSSWRDCPASQAKESVAAPRLWQRAWSAECGERFSSWASLLRAWKRVATVYQSSRAGNTGNAVVIFAAELEGPSCNFDVSQGCLAICWGYHVTAGLRNNTHRLPLPNLFY